LTNPNNEDALSFDQLKELVISALEDFKAIDIQIIDVSELNPLTELFVIASGSSSRHVKSMAENLIMRAKAAGCQPLGVEGQRPQARAFYNLEKLWRVSTDQRSSAGLPA